MEDDYSLDLTRSGDLRVDATPFLPVRHGVGLGLGWATVSQLHPRASGSQAIAPMRIAPDLAAICYLRALTPSKDPHTSKASASTVTPRPFAPQSERMKPIKTVISQRDVLATLDKGDIFMTF